MSTVPGIDLSRLNMPDLSGATIVKKLVEDGAPGLIRAFNNTLAKREQVLREDINQVASSVLLATATEMDLDQIVALFGIKRLEISPEQPDASPPLPAVMEDDARLRLRARLSLEALNQSGCKGAYVFHALSSSAHIKDISVFNEDYKTDHINMVVLSDEGRGDTSPEQEDILQSVEQVMKSTRSVTDDIHINWANIVEFPIKAELSVKEGEDAEAIYQNVKTKTLELLTNNHRLGKNILRDEFYSIMYQPGVENVNLLQPATDMAIGIDSAPYNSGDDEDPNNFQITVKTIPDTEISSLDPYYLALRSNKTLKFSAVVHKDDKK